MTRYALALAALSLSAAPLWAQDLECGTEYEIRRGDTLQRIARRAYGPDATYAPLLEANRDRFRGRDPSQIEIGERVAVPCLDAAVDGSETAVAEPEAQDAADGARAPEDGAPGAAATAIEPDRADASLRDEDAGVRRDEGDAAPEVSAGDAPSIGVIDDEEVEPETPLAGADAQAAPEEAAASAQPPAAEPSRFAADEAPGSSEDDLGQGRAEETAASDPPRADGSEQPPAEQVAIEASSPPLAMAAALRDFGAEAQDAAALAGLELRWSDESCAPRAAGARCGDALWSGPLIDQLLVVFDRVDADPARPRLCEALDDETSAALCVSELMLGRADRMVAPAGAADAAIARLDAGGRLVERPELARVRSLYIAAPVGADAEAALEALTARIAAADPTLRASLMREAVGAGDG